MSPQHQGRMERGAGLFEARTHRLSPGGRIYTPLVRVVKLVLPLCALILVGVVIARLAENPLLDQIAQLPADERTLPGRSELVGARYEGVDSSGRPFALVAEKAVRVAPDETASLAGNVGAGEIVDLIRPQAQIALPGQGLHLSANSGRFEQAALLLDLSGDVLLHDGQGNRLWLTRMRVLFEDNSLVSETPVSGHGPAGEIEAEGLRVEDNGAVVVFTGRTKVLLPVAGP